MSNIIIHISGVSGAGKKTLGNKLTEQFKNKIVVKDIDDLRRDFIKKYYGNKKFDIIDKVEYQKYIDNFVKKHASKPLIFVGLIICLGGILIIIMICIQFTIILLTWMMKQ